MNTTPQIISPNRLYEALNRIAVGQGDTKKVLAAAGFLHAAKSLYWAHYPRDVPLKKSNTLIMGPSGCGKTYMIRELGKQLRLPVLEIDASSLTTEGYVGLSFSEVLGTWYNNAQKQYPVNKLGSAIIFLDEFDKLALAGDGNVRNFKGSVLDNILKAMEGSIVVYEPNGMKAPARVYTGGMLFILGGNFEEIRRLRAQRKKPMGFNHSINDNCKSLQDELIQAGIKKEIIGRISYFAEVQPLNRAQMLRILKTKENNYYEQYQRLYSEIFFKELNLSDEELGQIVDKCMDLKVGARGLQAALDEQLVDRLFKEEIDLDDFSDIIKDTD